ncbi:uncharacterized protein [Venturia canescens]|uniref:uncharacterized protein n=1 Tax=Venturia canescens TaxID=32260 RepID=UPI001C9CA548|nr:uncharacterized protein LOC122407909 [Venturia canescens]XP_043270324.1 uncharacterized protein LOC122407909 [Venturia canescens]
MERDLSAMEDKIFFSNACHVCREWGKNVYLKRCSSCKMIAYCSREHQKKHWPQHKEICTILKELSILDFPDKNQSVLGYTTASWVAERQHFVECVQSIMQVKFNRKLLTFEREMLIHSRCCEICRETDPCKLKDCDECPDASFCSKHPKDARHSAKCKAMKLCFEISFMFLNYTIRIPSYPSDKMLQNMNCEIKRLMQRMPVIRSPAPKMFWGILISDELSSPLTFLYATRLLPSLVSPKMTIHVVAATPKDMCGSDCWELLFHYESTLKELQIVFIGPEVATEFEQQQLCKGCIENRDQKKRCRLAIHCVKNSYANFATGPLFTKPDYVVGFHLQLPDPHNKDTWTQSLKVVAELACPFFVTSFNAGESENKQKKINLLLGKEVTSYCTRENPFSSLQPYRTLDPDQLYYFNRYLTVYRKLS